MVFHFKHFDIIQSKQVFKIGTDGLLLALFIDANSNSFLEIGSGTGYLSIIMAHKYKSADIWSIDNNLTAYEITNLNFKNSPYSDRLHAIYGDIKAESFNHQFDLIFSNPPFFEVNSINQKYPQAKHQQTLSFEELLVSIKNNLSPHGVFWTIIPYLTLNPFIELAKNYQLFLHQIILIKGIKQGKIKRCILKFSFIPIDLIAYQWFIIEESPREYTQTYKDLVKDYLIDY